MFGPTEEAKVVMESLNQHIKKTWTTHEEQGSGVFANSEFIDVILSWREESHPRKFLGGLKTFDDFFFGIDILEDHAIRKIAEDIVDPKVHNRGEGFKKINFEKELILYCQIPANLIVGQQSSLILTNENLYMFMSDSSLGQTTIFKILPISNLHGTSIVIKASFTNDHKVEINNEKIGYMRFNSDNDNSISVIRDLLSAACNRAPITETQEEINSTTSEESALDKIKKLKELLDSGAITEEEFLEKKNSLMDSL